MSRTRSPYRLDLLPVVPPFNRRARFSTLGPGDLVYYGPMPSYYGIGEVVQMADRYVVVDFRGTGNFGVHRDTLEQQYLIPIPTTRFAQL